jgi:hypothetical protein
MLPLHPRAFVLSCALPLVPLAVLVAFASGTGASAPSYLAAIAAALALGYAFALAWRGGTGHAVGPHAATWMAALAVSPLLAFHLYAQDAIALATFDALFLLGILLNLVQLDAALRAEARPEGRGRD